LLTPRMRGLLTGLAVATGVVAVLSGAALATSTWVRTHVTYAVIVSPVASIREGPAKTFRSPFEVHEGLKVRVVQREQDFLRVRLPNGIEGWVNQNDAPTI
jgi:SH3-like domain-containing protein